MIDFDIEIERCLKIVAMNRNNSVMYSDFAEDDKIESSFGAYDLAERIANEMDKQGLIEKTQDRCDLTRFGAQVYKDGGWLKHIGKSKKMPNLDEILNEFIDVLAVHFPGGCRPLDFFNDKPYDYLANTVIEKGVDMDLIKWEGAIMTLSTNGYEVVQKGGYLNSIKEDNQFQGTGARFSNEDLSKKIDEILTQLKRNEMGTEIVFDELQEMKETAKVLNTKNWVQLLKGKLIDLAFDKAAGLTGKAAAEIFYEITGKHIDKFLN